MSLRKVFRSRRFSRSFEETRGVEEDRGRNKVANDAEEDESAESGVYGTSWSSLLPELLGEIIQRVEVSEERWPQRQNVVACACVCKRWRDSTKDIVRSAANTGKITFPPCLKQPGPRDMPSQCLIKRNKKTSTYYLYLALSPSFADKGKFLLAAKRIRCGSHIEYIISLDADDISQGSNAYVGKLRSDFLGINFTIYDSQPPHSGAKPSNFKSSRRFACKQISPQVSFSLVYSPLPSPASFFSKSNHLRRCFIMGFSAVYKSLQEIFPQIDARLLRAVAIENPKDPDEAAGIIINEIFPLMSERSKLPGSSPNKSICEDGTHKPCDEMLWNKEVVVGSSSMSHFVASVDEADPVNQNVAYNDDSNGEELPPTEKAKGSSVVTGSSKMFNGGSTGLINEAGETVRQEKTNMDVGRYSLISDPISMESHQPAEHYLRDDVNINLVLNEATEKYNFITFRNVPHQTSGHDRKDVFDIKLVRGEQQYFDASAGEEHGLITSKNVQESDSSALDDNCVAQPRQVDKGFLPNSEKQLVLEKESFSTSCDGTSSSKHDCSDNGDVDLESDSETGLVSQSSKMIKIDQLEDMINEAKSNKKMLFSSMESLMNLMREVELKEKAAEEAKMEAAMAGSDALIRVEELKEMLAHAKGANAMHAGEIYGEKAILATEMRELQSRLTSLSEERDKSLTILDEMHQTLEARLAAAEELRNAAEEEKLRKEEIAQNALARQQAIMETVVEESNRLHQEAEENAKLRDFLIDRGHLVDMLQGEISVICQDVKILKVKIDANLPLSKSFTPAQTTCALASSGSSVRSVASDLIAEQNFLSETLKRSPSSSMGNLSPKSKLVLEGVKTDSKSPEASPLPSMNRLTSDYSLEAETVNNDLKYLNDDGLESWEIFDKDAELAM